MKEDGEGDKKLKDIDDVKSEAYERSAEKIKDVNGNWELTICRT